MAQCGVFREFYQENKYVTNIWKLPPGYGGHIGNQWERLSPKSWSSGACFIATLFDFGAYVQTVIIVFERMPYKADWSTERKTSKYTFPQGRGAFEYYRALKPLWGECWARFQFQAETQILVTWFQRTPQRFPGKLTPGRVSRNVWLCKLPAEMGLHAKA